MLINPTVRPYDDLQPWRGVQTNLYTGEAFEVTQRAFRRAARAAPSRASRGPERYLLLVETGDEVLDYREAVAFYGGAYQYVRGGGDHAFTEFAAQTPGDPALRRRGECAMMTRHFDVVVIGGGLVGAAIAFGLRDLGPRSSRCSTKATSRIAPRAATSA